MREQPYEPLAERVRALVGDSRDLDMALAIMNQARLRSGSLDAEQVIHLLSIGYGAGFKAAREMREVGR